MQDTKTQTKTQARRARQEAVMVHHRDMSTEEITARITSHTTLISLYEAQRTRGQRQIQETTTDMRTCDRVLDELRADVTTLSSLIKTRRS